MSCVSVDGICNAISCIDMTCHVYVIVVSVMLYLVEI